MDIDKILKKLRISELNEMQQHAAEAILCSDGDVVLLSPTGTGKTLAYLLPLIQQLDATSDDVQALVVVPGRELALQSDTVLRDMGSGIRSASCYGGRATMDEHRKLKEVNPQIIFGTPGRLNDHLDKENINRYHIRWLVIDEFDKCLAMGFHQEMQKLIKSLPALQRRILLSATNAEQIPQFVNMAKKGTLVDFLPEEEQTSERVTLYEVKSPQKDKLETLRNLLFGFGNESSIVFLNYRDSVELWNRSSARQPSTVSPMGQPTYWWLPILPHVVLISPTFRTLSITTCPRARKVMSIVWVEQPVGTSRVGHSSSQVRKNISLNMSRAT